MSIEERVEEIKIHLYGLIDELTFDFHEFKESRKINENIRDFIIKSYNRVPWVERNYGITITNYETDLGDIIDIDVTTNGVKFYLNGERFTRSGFKREAKHS